MENDCFQGCMNLLEIVQSMIRFYNDFNSEEKIILTQKELVDFICYLIKTIELYNEINPQARITLEIEDKKVMLERLQRAFKLYCDLKDNEKKDVSDIFVCVYDKKCIGLFKKRKLSIENSYQLFGKFPSYGEIIIYEGVDSDLIGIKKINSILLDKNIFNSTNTKEIVDGISYISNCNINSVISFEKMRFIMANDCKMSSYEKGVASNQEIYDVLVYAYSYYRINNNMLNRRVRKKKS